MTSNQLPPQPWECQPSPGGLGPTAQCVVGSTAGQDSQLHHVRACDLGRLHQLSGKQRAVWPTLLSGNPTSFLLPKSKNLALLCIYAHLFSSDLVVLVPVSGISASLPSNRIVKYGVPLFIDHFGIAGGRCAQGRDLGSGGGVGPQSRPATKTTVGGGGDSHKKGDGYWVPNRRLLPHTFA